MEPEQQTLRRPTAAAGFFFGVVALLVRDSPTKSQTWDEDKRIEFAPSKLENRVWAVEDFSLGKGLKLN